MGKFVGTLTDREEFLYPDSPHGVLPEALEIHMPLNGKPGIQLIIKTDGCFVTACADGSFDMEYYEMRAVPVEYNTGDGVSQGGAMVLENPPEMKPDYVTRLAPFEVYDCLIRRPDGCIGVKDGTAALYICLAARGTEAGTYGSVLSVQTQEGTYRCRLTVHIHNVTIPENTFHVTNWFSDESICRFHNVKKGTPEYIGMLEKYALAMRRMHQNVFFIQLDERCIISKDPYIFDFEYLTPEIDCFFKSGMQLMELGVLLDRGFLENGMPDMYTDSFKCAMAKDVPVDTKEGYAITVTFVKSLAAYLKAHGWEDKVLFHIHDEPDIHYRDEETLEARRRQYYLAASILRKYIPGVRTIEAVDSAGFRGGIDIWVPGTAGYEAKKAEFDRLTDLGETVWTYVCCGPEGQWLNRFLDFALIKGRLLFWGCAKNRISGFLHWGLNQFQNGMNPYKGTSCPNHTGIGTNFPCGDSFIVYPGEDGPEIGMRMEAARRGAEDAALWQLLRKKDEPLCEALLSEAFTNNYTYNDDPKVLKRIYEKLLVSLEK